MARIGSLLLVLVTAAAAGCSVRIVPSDPPANSDEPSATPSTTSIPGPPIRWRQADLGELADEFVQISQVAEVADGLVASALIRDYDAFEPARRLLGSIDGLIWEVIEGPGETVDVAFLASAGGRAWAFGRDAEVPSGLRLWTSVNGDRWEEIPEVTGLDLGLGFIGTLAAHDGSLVALASDAITPEDVRDVLLRSQDGQRWTEVGELGSRALTSGPEGYVALSGLWGRAAEAWHSIDGTAWTRHAMPGDKDVIVWNATFGHDRYLGVGQTSVNPDERPAALWSDDGKAWFGAEVAGTEPGRFQLVTAAPEGFFAVSSDIDDLAQRHMLWWSRDGTSWSPIEAIPELNYAADALTWRELVVVAGRGEAGPVIWVGEPED